MCEGMWTNLFERKSCSIFNTFWRKTDFGSCLCYSLALCHVTSLGCDFLICRVEIITIPASYEWCKVKGFVNEDLCYLKRRNQLIDSDEFSINLGIRKNRVEICILQWARTVILAELTNIFMSEFPHL